jgi:hypothetical protein
MVKIGTALLIVSVFCLGFVRCRSVSINRNTEMTTKNVQPVFI